MLPDPMLPDFMVLDVQDRRDHTALAVTGELDLAGGALLADAIGLGPLRASVVIELAGVTFVDVAGARALEGAVADLRRHGRRVTIGSMDEGVRRRLALAGAGGLLEAR